jgi:hypothetical protein
MGPSYEINRTVHVHIIAPTSETLERSNALFKVIQTLKTSAGARSISAHRSNATADVQASPVDDLDAAVRALPFDPKSITIERNIRQITVNLTSDSNTK